MNNISIETERLILRSMSRADAAGPYLRWMRDPEILRYLEARFLEFTEDGLATYIERCNDDGTVMLLAICLKEDGTHIGNIKLGPINGAHSRADVGFLIGDKGQWGKGFAPEAIDAVARHAFDQLRLHKVTAGIYEENTGSRRALAKAGFVEEGYRAEQYFCDGKWTGGILVGRVAGRETEDMTA